MSQLPRRLHRVLAEAPVDRRPSDGRIAALVRAELPTASDRSVQGVVEQVRSRLEGFGALDPILADAEVTDVLVNGPGPVWVERAGRLVRTEVVLDRAEVELLVERIVAPVGRRADPVHPIADARLPDGSRAHVVVPPLAVDGPYLSIRRFRVRTIPLADLAAPPVAALLADRVRDRANLVVSGGTGSGKTTLLNALAGAIPQGQRIVTVEDAAELRLATPHVVRLEARPPVVDGAPEVTIRDLVRAALRMRPDRVIVGEARGAEAAELVTAMTTGHDGSLTTVHANGAADALARLQLLVLSGEVGLPADAIARLLAEAVDLVVHVARCADGRRQVVEVVEPVHLEGRSEVRVLARTDRVVATPERRRREPSATPMAGGHGER